MARAQPQHIRRLLPALHLEHRAESNVLAERAQRAIDGPRPRYGTYEQRHKERRQDVGLAQGENANHEEEEDDDTPDEADERDRPRLPL